LGATKQITTRMHRRISCYSCWKNNKLKGTVDSPEIFISFTDVKIASAHFPSNKEYIWLLYPYGDSENKYGTKNFSSIYTTEKENEILRIIQNS
jgi:hypothetical protein